MTAATISGNPMTKAEACRWIRRGIELTAIDTKTNLPISNQDGFVAVVGRQWSGVATLVSGVITRIE